MQGLSALQANDYARAEEAFQMAVRWAQNPTSQLVSMTNVGFMECVGRNWTPHQTLVYQDELHTPSHGFDAESIRGLEESIECWQDGINDAASYNSPNLEEKQSVTNLLPRLYSKIC